MELTAVVLAAVPLLLVLLVYLYVRRRGIRRQSGRKTKSSNQNKSESNASSKSSKISQSNSNKSKKSSKKNGKPEINSVISLSTQPVAQDALEEPSPPSKIELCVQKVHVATSSNEEVDSNISSLPNSTIKAPNLVKEVVPEVETLTHDLKAQESDIILNKDELPDSQYEVKSEEYSEVEKAFDELELQAKMMFESAKLSSSQSMVHKQEKLHLGSKIQLLEKQLSSQKNISKSKISSLENQLQVLRAEKLQSSAASEHETYRLKTLLESQMSKLNQQDDHLKKFEFSLDKTNTELQESIKEKEMLNQELLALKDNYNNILVKYQDLHYANFHSQQHSPSKNKKCGVSVADVLKSLDTQLGIRIQYDDSMLEDPLTVSTRIFKAINMHSLANEQTSKARKIKSVQQTVDSINTFLTSQFNDCNLVSLETLNSEEQLKNWLASLKDAIASQEAKTSPAAALPTNQLPDELPTQPNHTPSASSSANASDSTTVSDYLSAGNRTVTSDVYFALVDKLGADKIPVLTPNISEWVDNLLKSLEICQSQTSETSINGVATCEISPIAD